jgi:hypothetical protein
MHSDLVTGVPLSVVIMLLSGIYRFPTPRMHNYAMYIELYPQEKLRLHEKAERGMSCG